MNNILSLKTVGLSYASTNLSFAFALYFNVSMFLLYHNPPLFSITRRTCPNVFLFGVQIPVDACTFLGLKRRSFLFVIDKKQPLLRLFLYTGESVRFNKTHTALQSNPPADRKWREKQALAFAEIERSGHSQQPDTKCQMQSISAKARLLSVDASLSNPPCCPQRAEGTHHAAGTSLLPKAKTSRHRFCVHSIFVFSPRKNRPKYGRFFVVWIYCFLLKNALLILLFFVEQCFDCGN